MSLDMIALSGMRRLSSAPLPVPARASNWVPTTFSTTVFSSFRVGACKLWRSLRVSQHRESTLDGVRLRMAIPLRDSDARMARYACQRERIAARRCKVRQGRVPETVRREGSELRRFVLLGLSIDCLEGTGMLVLGTTAFEMPGLGVSGEYPAFRRASLRLVAGM